MSLYRAKPQDGAVWITGASTGIGRELAIAMAKAGWTVAATARSADKLVGRAAFMRFLPMSRMLRAWCPPSMRLRQAPGR
jgi:NAD(P)-dependent dehydrogenase (short-subunit alcohol dehydrogenase family)